MKILVTGANGYLGTGVVDRLIADGVEVIATDFCGDNVNKKARFIQADLFQLDDPYTYFDRPDVVLHMAWRDGFVHNSSRHFEDLPKHINFIQNMLQSGIKKIAVMGSMHEIGFFEGCIT